MRLFTVVALLVGISAAAQAGTEIRKSAEPAKAAVRVDVRASVQTLTGVVSCEWQVIGRYECRRRAPQDCVRECVSVGSAYVLMVDKEMYWLDGSPSELNKVAGGRAVVTGVVNGKKLRVTTITDEPQHLSLRFWK
jgi:hypothetical protein